MCEKLIESILLNLQGFEFKLPFSYHISLIPLRFRCLSLFRIYRWVNHSPSGVDWRAGPRHFNFEAPSSHYWPKSTSMSPAAQVNEGRCNRSHFSEKKVLARARTSAHAHTHAHTHKECRTCGMDLFSHASQLSVCVWEGKRILGVNTCSTGENLDAPRLFYRRWFVCCANALTPRKPQINSLIKIKNNCFKEKIYLFFAVKFSF